VALKPAPAETVAKVTRNQVARYQVTSIDLNYCVTAGAEAVVVATLHILHVENGLEAILVFCGSTQVWFLKCRILMEVRELPKTSKIALGTGSSTAKHPMAYFRLCLM
jgi:hypothetical protein